MKYSVILPIYINTTLSDINRSIQSITLQTYKNIEIILICDGPIKNDVDVYINAIYGNIKIIYILKNCGPGLARNIGVKNSTGDYIVIMDSDDSSVVNRIERANEYLKKTTAKIYCANINEFNGFSNKVKKNKIINNKYSIMYLFNPINNVSLVIERDTFINLFGYANLRYGEDFVLIAKAISTNCNIFYDDFIAVNAYVDNNFYNRRFDNFLLKELLLCRELIKISYFNYYHLSSRILIKILLAILPYKILRYIRNKIDY
jgi:glycosyltransferase involved in cell wall biosynthesis